MLLIGLKDIYTRFFMVIKIYELKFVCVAKVVTQSAPLASHIMMRTEESVPVWTSALVTSTTLWLNLVLK